MTEDEKGHNLSNKTVIIVDKSPRRIILPGTSPENARRISQLHGYVPPEENLEKHAKFMRDNV